MRINAISKDERNEKISYLRDLDNNRGWEIMRGALLDNISELKLRLQEINMDRTDQGLIAHARRIDDINRDIVGLQNLVDLPERLCAKLDSMDRKQVETTLDPYGRI